MKSIEVEGQTSYHYQAKANSYQMRYIYLLLYAATIVTTCCTLDHAFAFVPQEALRIKLLGGCYSRSFRTKQECTRDEVRQLSSLHVHASSYCNSRGLDDNGEDELLAKSMDMLRGMTTYFSSMVDQSTNRFYSISRPPTGELSHQNCPLRDLGVTWDALTLLLFWSTCTHPWKKVNQEMNIISDAVTQTLRVYIASLIKVQGSNDENDVLLFLDSNSRALGEPSNIAHSGFLIATSTAALRLSLLQDGVQVEEEETTMTNLLHELVYSILKRQMPNGAFRVEFENNNAENIYKMIAFYPGEAMVGLMEVYDHAQLANMPDCTRHDIISAMKRAFPFYKGYHREGDVDVNYSVWQVQAFSRLFHALDQEDDNDPFLQPLGQYVLDLCEDIVRSPSWRMLARGTSFYPNLQTVEIACGMDAIMEGMSVAQKLQRDDIVALFDRNAINAVEFLHVIQHHVDDNSIVGNGGLGYGGITVMEQRLDVTGHAIHALIKFIHMRSQR